MSTESISFSYFSTCKKKYKNVFTLPAWFWKRNDLRISINQVKTCCVLSPSTVCLSVYSNLEMTSSVLHDATIRCRRKIIETFFHTSAIYFRGLLQMSFFTIFSWSIDSLLICKASYGQTIFKPSKSIQNSSQFSLLFLILAEIDT